MIPANLRIRVEDSSEVGNDVKLRNQSIALRAPPSSPAANISNVGISSLPVARIRPHNGNLERLGNWKLDVKKLKQDELSPAHVTTASTTTESILSSGKSRGSTKHKTQRRYGVLSPSGGAWNQTAGWASPRIVDNPASKKNPSPASSPTERRLRPSSSSKISSAKRHQKDMWTVSRTTLGNNGRTSSDKKMAKKQRNVKLRQPESSELTAVIISFGTVTNINSRCRTTILGITYGKSNRTTKRKEVSKADMLCFRVWKQLSAPVLWLVRPQPCHNLGPLILPTTSLFNTQHHVKEEQRNTSDSEQIEEDDIDLEVSSVMSVWASPRFHQSSTPTGRGSKKGKSPRGWIQHKKSPRELLLKKSPRELLREVQQDSTPSPNSRDIPAWDLSPRRRSNQRPNQRQHRQTKSVHLPEIPSRRQPKGHRRISSMRFSDRHVQRLQINGTEYADSSDQVDSHMNERGKEIRTRDSVDMKKLKEEIVIQKSRKRASSDVSAYSAKTAPARTLENNFRIRGHTHLSDEEIKLARQSRFALEEKRRRMSSPAREFDATTRAHIKEIEEASGIKIV
eukprot:jgi/Bigna1/90491/estExt_fgenesh1_pg.C_710095